MGLDFVERFFKLTLDNVYRFACSLLFAVAFLCNREAAGPIARFTELLDWLAIPSAWLTPVAAWLADRQEAVGLIAALVLAVALIFSASPGWRSRSGSTALLSIVVLMETGWGGWLLGGLLAALALLALVTGIVSYISRRMNGYAPGWVKEAWEGVANASVTLFLAVCYLLSPLGWLISQESYVSRGSRMNPIYVEQIEDSGPTGALPR